MPTQSEDGKQLSRHERRIAWGRVILGQLQIVGATCTLVLLLRIGVTALTIWTAVLTAALTVASRLIFKEKEGRQ